MTAVKKKDAAQALEDLAEKASGGSSDAAKYLPEWQELIEGVKVHDAITLNGVTKSYWSINDPQSKQFKLVLIADYKCQHIKMQGDLKKPLNVPMANVPFFTPIA